jgi:hypothetical protein
VSLAIPFYEYLVQKIMIRRGDNFHFSLIKKISANHIYSIVNSKSFLLLSCAKMVFRKGGGTILVFAYLKFCIARKRKCTTLLLFFLNISAKNRVCLLSS